MAEVMDKQNLPDNGTETLIAVEKPQSPWMVGLLVMIFGVLGMAVSAMNLYLGIINLGNVRSDWTSVGLDMNYVYFSLVAGLLMGVWMSYIGIRVLGYKDNGRQHFNYYIIFFILWTLGTTFYQYMAVPEGFARQVILNDMLPELLGKAAMLALFIFCAYLLNRPATRNWLT